MKNTKTKLISSVTVLLICFAMLIGSTFAWFTDSASTGVNKIQAGNLDIDVIHSNAYVSDQPILGEEHMFVDVSGNDITWEPGVASYEKITVKNVGSLALKYKLAMNITDYNALSTSTTKTLKKVIKVKVLQGDDMIEINNRSDIIDAVDWSSVTTTLDTFSQDLGKLYPAGNASSLPDEEIFQVLVYWQPSSNDDTYNLKNGVTTTDGQPLFIKFGLNITATQLDYESDSFDNEYDKGLILPDLPANIDKVFETKELVLNAGETSYTGTQSVSIKNKSTNETVATMPATAANAIGNKMLELANDKAVDSDLSTTILLSVEKDDSITATNTVTYNINASAVAAYTDYNGVSQTKQLSESETDEVLRDANAITKVTINIGKNLENVKVKHNNVSMNLLSSVNEDAEGYYYNSITGVLTIKSITFSPFTIAYTISNPIARIGDVGYSDLYVAVSNLKSSETLELLEDVTIEKYYTYSGWKYATYSLRGKMEGNGHKITLPEGVYFAYSTSNGSTINNVDFDLTNSSIAINSYGIEFNNVNTYGSMEVGGNEAPYLIYSWGGEVVLRNCTNYVNMTGIGGSGDYNSAFVGYSVSNEGPFTFVNCINKGEIICGRSSLFLANPNSYVIRMNIENCSNEGTLISTYVDNAYKMNYYSSTPSNNYTSFIINGVDQGPYQGTNTIPNIYEDTLINNSGNVYNGPLNTGISLAIDENNNFVVTPAVDGKVNGTTVAKYVVSSGLYVGMSNGSTRFYATEEILVEDNARFTTTMKNLGFVDKEFAGEAIVENIGNNRIVTLDDKQYYLVGDDESTRGSVKSATIQYVSAYDANGKLLASVSCSE